MKDDEKEYRERRSMSILPSLYENAQRFIGAHGIRSVSQLVEDAIEEYMVRHADDEFGLQVRARNYSAKKTASIDFEEDVLRVVREAGVPVDVKPDLGGFRPDFLINGRVIVEAKHSLDNVELAAGQAMLYSALIKDAEVIILIPYWIGSEQESKVRKLLHGRNGISIMDFAEFRKFVAKFS